MLMIRSRVLVFFLFVMVLGHAAVFGQGEAVPMPTPASGPAPKIELVPQMVPSGVPSVVADIPILNTIYEILAFPLLTVDGEPITPLKLALALVVFLLGLHIASRIADVARKRLLKRVTIPPDSVAVMEKVVRYVILVLVALYSMDIAGIPITIFTFLGGAVAIAIGFGGQEILGNFMSGLILLTERPIRIGDLIEFDGHLGKVQEVGARCTKLLMPGNVHLLVPNRDLVENKIVNWTLDDSWVRSEVTVGVAYGTDLKLARELLLRATEPHEEIRKSERKPYVLFKDFGDNALVLTLYFWTKVEDFGDRNCVESDVRFSIDELCRENSINIAFPQRDIHLDTNKPLEVKMVS